MPLRTWRFNHTGSTPELHEDSTSLHFALLRLSRTSSASFNHGEVPAVDARVDHRVALDPDQHG